MLTHLTRILSYQIEQKITRNATETSIPKNLGPAKAFSLSIVSEIDTESTPLLAPTSHHVLSPIYSNNKDVTMSVPATSERGSPISSAVSTLEDIVKRKEKIKTKSIGATQLNKPLTRSCSWDGYYFMKKKEYAVNKYGNSIKEAERELRVVARIYMEPRPVPVTSNSTLPIVRH